jgi:hypothetical protein
MEREPLSIFKGRTSPPFDFLAHSFGTWQADPGNQITLATGNFGLATEVGGRSTLFGLSGRYVRYLSGAVIGNNGGITALNTVNWIRAVTNKPVYQAHFRTDSDLSSIRIQVGIGSQPNNDAFVLAGQTGFGLRFSTVAGDAVWTCVLTNNGATITSPTTLAPQLNTEYAVRIRVTASGLSFQLLDITNNVSSFVTINTPVAPTLANDILNGSLMCCCATQVAASRALQVQRLLLAYTDDQALPALVL